ncbi:hypothetical protein HDU76_012465 [Blyttiomyces sp. JEL0837]|nr:hypothetical protein HDU76_012465 [Blyttiomyces sp. JEL0837]
MEPPSSSPLVSSSVSLSATTDTTIIDDDNDAQTETDDDSSKSKHMHMPKTRRQQPQQTADNTNIIMTSLTQTHPPPTLPLREDISHTTQPASSTSSSSTAAAVSSLSFSSSSFSIPSLSSSKFATTSPSAALQQHLSSASHSVLAWCESTAISPATTNMSSHSHSHSHSYSHLHHHPREREQQEQPATSTINGEIISSSSSSTSSRPFTQQQHRQGTFTRAGEESWKGVSDTMPVDVEEEDDEVTIRESSIDIGQATGRRRGGGASKSKPKLATDGKSKSWLRYQRKKILQQQQQVHQSYEVFATDDILSDVMMLPFANSEYANSAGGKLSQNHASNQIGHFGRLTGGLQSQSHNTTTTTTTTPKPASASAKHTTVYNTYNTTSQSPSSSMPSSPKTTTSMTFVSDYENEYDDEGMMGQQQQYDHDDLEDDRVSILTRRPTASSSISMSGWSSVSGDEVTLHNGDEVFETGSSGNGFVVGMGIGAGRMGGIGQGQQQQRIQRQLQQQHHHLHQSLHLQEHESCADSVTLNNDDGSFLGSPASSLFSAFYQEQKQQQQNHHQQLLEQMPPAHSQSQSQSSRSVIIHDEEDEDDEDETPTTPTSSVPSHLASTSSSVFGGHQSSQSHHPHINHIPNMGDLRNVTTAASSTVDPSSRATSVPASSAGDSGPATPVSFSVPGSPRFGPCHHESEVSSRAKQSSSSSSSLHSSLYDNTTTTTAFSLNGGDDDNIADGNSNTTNTTHVDSAKVDVESRTTESTTTPPPPPMMDRSPSITSKTFSNSSSSTSQQPQQEPPHFTHPSTKSTCPRPPRPSVLPFTNMPNPTSLVEVIVVVVTVTVWATLTVYIFVMSFFVSAVCHLARELPVLIGLVAEGFGKGREVVGGIVRVAGRVAKKVGVLYGRYLDPWVNRVFDTYIPLAMESLNQMRAGASHKPGTSSSSSSSSSSWSPTAAVFSTTSNATTFEERYRMKEGTGDAVGSTASAAVVTASSSSGTAVGGGEDGKVKAEKDNGIAEVRVSVVEDGRSDLGEGDSSTAGLRRRHGNDGGDEDCEATGQRLNNSRRDSSLYPVPVPATTPMGGASPGSLSPRYDETGNSPKESANTSTTTCYFSRNGDGTAMSTSTPIPVTTTVPVPAPPKTVIVNQDVLSCRASVVSSISMSSSSTTSSSVPSSASGGCESGFSSPVSSVPSSPVFRRRGVSLNVGLGCGVSVAGEVGRKGEVECGIEVGVPVLESSHAEVEVESADKVLPRAPGSPLEYSTWDHSMGASRWDFEEEMGGSGSGTTGGNGGKPSLPVWKGWFMRKGGSQQSSPVVQTVGGGSTTGANGSRRSLSTSAALMSLFSRVNSGGSVKAPGLGSPAPVVLDEENESEERDSVRVIGGGGATTTTAAVPKRTLHRRFSSPEGAAVSSVSTPITPTTTQNQSRILMPGMERSGVVAGRG